MISQKEFTFIKENIFRQLSFQSEIEFTLTDHSDIYILCDREKAEISGTVKSNTARALAFFVKNSREGKTRFEISETKHFRSLGFSLDVSRNAVMSVAQVKEFINILACLGYDSFALYMEDTFELEGSPYFGYRRGRYTREELKEIDDYAFGMGIEVVPSVQTLGHLEQYLRWKEADGIKDNTRVLLCEEEKTYDFIEKIIRTMRSAFRSNRIIIGCDEADGLGLGRYLEKHSYKDKYALATEHLKRVCGICQKYDFRPMVAGDLYFSHFGKGYYDFDIKIRSEETADIPDMDIFYWDYYHTEYEDYQKLLELHRQLGRPVSFMGGIWTWCGMLPNLQFTLESMEPALDCALDHQVEDIWAATYGDDGTETNLKFAIPALSLFSEKCFKGKNCKKSDVEEMSELVTGVPTTEFLALSHFHYPFIEGLEKWEYIYPNYMGKKIFYTDVLYNFTNTYDFTKIREEYLKGYREIEEAGTGTEWETFFDYARLIYQIAIEKTDIIPRIKNAYQCSDMKTLAEIASEQIPGLIEKYRRLHEIYEEMWLSTNKVFGWEELDTRIGGITARLHYAGRTLKKYISGKISQIEELEYDFIEDAHGAFPYGGVCWYKDLKSCGL